MSRSIQEKWPWLAGSRKMRLQVLDILDDADLAFSPGGQNMTLGALLREMGDIEHSYVQSLRTFKQDWSYHNTEAGLENSVAQIRAWYQTLDGEMQATISALSDEDLTRLVDRGRFSATVERQIEIYREALLVFFGKIIIYLKAMNKPLPQQMQDYFG